MYCIRTILFILGLLIFSSEAMEPYQHHSLQTESLRISLLRETPVEANGENNIESVDVGHLSDQSIVNKIELIDQLLLLESPPLSCKRFSSLAILTMAHTFFAASASAGVFLHTCRKILHIDEGSGKAIGMIVWLVLSQTPGIANQFWSMFQSEPWEESEFIYQKNYKHKAASIAAGLLVALNTSPWVYQMLLIEKNFIYIFAIPAVPFYFLMHFLKSYKIVSKQIDGYFYGDVYPKNSVFTRNKREKLARSLMDGLEVVKNADNDGVDIIFNTLINKRLETNDQNRRKDAYHLSSEIIGSEEKEEAEEETDLEQETNEEELEGLRITQSSDDVSQSAWGALMGVPAEGIAHITSSTQELAWQNAKYSTERIHDYPLLKPSLDKVVGFISVLDAVAHVFVLYNILHFLPPELAFTGCGIGSIGRGTFHYAPRCQTMRTIIVDRLVKRSILIPLSCPLITAVSVMDIVTAGLQTTIPYVLADVTLQTYPSVIRILLMGSLIAGNFLDYSGALIESDLSFAEKDPSFSLRNRPCELVRRCFQKTSECVRSKLQRKKLLIKSYSNRAQCIVERGTEKLLTNLGYYFLNEF